MRYRPMKTLWLAVGGLTLMSACGGGGGGGSVGSTPAPPSPSVVISPSTETNIDQGQSIKFNASVENDSSGKGVSWSVSAAGLTGSADGTVTNATTTTAMFNAPTSGAANLSVTVTATSVDDTSAASSALVMVMPPPSITNAALVNATPNANYSATLQATGGVGTLAWSVASGALPAGLVLSSSGVISGVPTASGDFTFTSQVTDASAAAAGGASAQAQFSLTVVTPVTVDTTALPSGAEGITYLSAITASGGTPPYTWSVALGSLPAGLTLQSSSGVISGAPTAQGSVSFSVAVEDSSPTRQTQTQPLTMIIGAPEPLAITTSALLDGTVSSPYTATVAALGGSPPYTWSVAAGALPTGMSLNPSTGFISGTPASTGTASFTVMAADSSSPPQTQTQALSLTVDDAAEACGSTGNNAVLNGPYAFSLSGFNDVGFLTVVGSFTADGTGKITAGEADTNGVLGPQQGAIIASASSYSAGPDNRGCATLATTFGTFTVHFAASAIASGVAASGRVIEWNSLSASAYIAAGQLLRQTTSAFAAGLAGSYTFLTAGWDPSALGGRDACAGTLSAVGNSFTALQQDCNDAWVVSTLQSPDTTGTYTSFDSHGRATAIVTLGDSNFNITLYAVSSSRLLTVNADPGAAVSGEWDQQNVGSSGFSQASLAGNMVLYLNGLSLDGTASAASIETASADGSSSLSINFYEDRAGVMQLSSTLVCTYAVQTNGRVTLSSGTQSCGGTPPVFYLTGQNTGFIVDASPGVDAGSFEPQSAGPFSNATLAANFAGGTAEVVIPSAQPEVDAVTANGSGGITGATDFTSNNSQDTGAPFPAAAYNVNSDGSFSLNSSGGAVVGIIISPEKFVMLSSNTSASSYPTLLVMQQ